MSAFDPKRTFYVWCSIAQCDADRELNHRSKACWLLAGRLPPGSLMFPSAVYTCRYNHSIVILAPWDQDGRDGRVMQAKVKITDARQAK
jgi:hypothetical protein